jgi:hypothetical protein
MEQDIRPKPLSCRRRGPPPNMTREVQKVGSTSTAGRLLSLYGRKRV